jgi:hypothetical protein
MHNEIVREITSVILPLTILSHSAMPSESEKITKLKKELFQANSDRQREHDLRCTLMGDNETLQEFLTSDGKELDYYKNLSATIAQQCDKLIGYAQHDGQCATDGWPSQECDCGLTTLIQEIRGKV